MRLTTLNKVKGFYMEKIAELGDYTSQQMEDFIAGIESIDYDDEENSDIEEIMPREYRNEIVAWLRAEYV